MREKRPIKVYIRVRPFSDEEKERNEASALEIYKEESRIKVLDERHSLETSYFFDGVFSAEDTNEMVYIKTARPLVNKLLNGINCALLTYGQTGTGKTYTVLAEGSVTSFLINHLFDRISQDVAHTYKVTCSFVQVYQDKVYDLLSSNSKDELFVREHPAKGIYVSNLSHHAVGSAKDALDFLNEGRKELIIAETKMVRQSSRSHAIFQICLEKRRDSNKDRSQDQHKHGQTQNYPFNSDEYDVNNSFECEEAEMYPMTLEEDSILRGKIDICDLAGSERLGKTMAEGVRLSEAKHINSSLLELGNVIYALSEGTKRHIPFRNSTLTRLLQECLGPQCRTSFIVCVAPTASEAYETRCSLNFGTRARKITNKERLILNVEVDYKILARRLARRIECLEQQLVKGGPVCSSFNKTEIEPPISIEIQTTRSLSDIASTYECDPSNTGRFGKLYSIPQLEIIIISDILNTLFQNAREKGTVENHWLLCKLSPLLQDFLNVVLSRKQRFTSNEASWTETDVELMLQESLNDLSLISDANTMRDTEGITQANDVLKYADYMYEQFEERCRKIEEDINFYLEKFNGIIFFGEERNIHQRMKKFIVFLENNEQADMKGLTNDDDYDGLDSGFLTWIVNVHMALRFTLLILGISKSIAASVDPICTYRRDKSDENDPDVLNETFDSISTINDNSTLGDLEKSFINFNMFPNYAANVFNEQYSTCLIPERGRKEPFAVQDGHYSLRKELHSFDAKPSFSTTRSFADTNLSSCLDQNLWANNQILNVSLASDVQNEDSIDVTLDDMEVPHEQRLRQRRLMDANITKLEDKCEALEDKNAKLVRTLNVIMKENKDVNEKLRLSCTEKARIMREYDDIEHKHNKMAAQKKSLERSLELVQMEKKKWENEALKLNAENQKIQMEINTSARQLSLKENENESLRGTISELRTEQTLTNSDKEFLCKQLEEKDQKLQDNDKQLDGLCKEKEELASQLREICSVLESVKKDEGDNDVRKCRKRSKSQNTMLDDTTFETELFVAIENNIRIEGIINDVTSKIMEIAGVERTENVQELNSKSNDAVKFAETTTVIKPQKAKTSKRSIINTDTKTSTLRRSKSLKAENERKTERKSADKVNSGLPRSSKIKELMNAKLKTENSYKELLIKNDRTEEELKTAKNQIEMLVKECGTLDHELVKLRRMSKLTENDSRFVESTSLYEKLADDVSDNEECLFLKTQEIVKLGDKQQQLQDNFEISQAKVNELEHELELSKENFTSMKRQTREVERRYDEVKSELQHYQNQNYNQKIENSRIRDHVQQLIQELNREKQRVVQINAKMTALKEKYTTQIAKMEAELMRSAKKLDKYRERERERRNENKRKDSSTVNEADSGLVPDQSEDYLDLT